ncbi:hypothetical protein SNE40_000230 [Patella caerulea]|uniref:Uncharacterized protein n=1 Tax=Patella caerulea TaxID=87958 RepID=A0AAN8KBU3_PATCE
MRCIMITVCIVLCGVTFGESKIRNKRQAAYGYGGYGAVAPNAQQAAYGMPSQYGAAANPAQYSAYGAAANPAGYGNAAYQPAYQQAAANPAYGNVAYQQAAPNPAYGNVAAANPAIGAYAAVQAPGPYGYATTP